MGDEERLSATQDELGLLLDELRSFNANRAAGVQRKCISNLYYSGFHAVRTLLLSHGLESRTHEGTQRLFAAHFVKPGLFAKDHLKTLGRLEADRLRADYQGYHQFDAKDVTGALDRILPLVDDVLTYLDHQDPRISAMFDSAIRAALAGNASG